MCNSQLLVFRIEILVSRTFLCVLLVLLTKLNSSITFSILLIIELVFLFFIELAIGVNFNILYPWMVGFHVWCMLIFLRWPWVLEKVKLKLLSLVYFQPVRMSTPARKRLMRDFKRLQQDPPAGISGAPQDNNIMLWNAVIFGYDLFLSFFLVRICLHIHCCFRHLLMPSSFTYYFVGFCRPDDTPWDGGIFKFWFLMSY